MYPYSEKPKESVWKEEATLEKCLGKPSVDHIQAYQTDFLLPPRGIVLVRGLEFTARNRPMTCRSAPRRLTELLPRRKTMLSTKKSIQCRFNVFLLM